MIFNMQIIVTEKTGKISIEADSLEAAKMFLQHDLEDGHFILDSDTIEFSNQEIVEYKE